MPSKSLADLEAMVGDSHVTSEGLTVEAGKVEEFARAIGDDNPVYRDAAAAAEAGSDAVLAPPTFLRTAFFDRYRPAHLGDMGTEFGVAFGFEIGFDVQYTMHAEHEYEYERPLAVGQTLTGTTTLADVSQNVGEDRTLTFAVFETEFRDERDDLVVTERATNVEVLPADVAADQEGDA